MKNNKGFSLIELSIVLIIFSMMIVGIAGGTSLVGSARINIMCSEIEAYRKAFIEYYDKYGFIAGKDVTSGTYSADAWNALFTAKLIESSNFNNSVMVSASKKAKYFWIKNTSGKFTEFSEGAVILEAQTNKTAGKYSLTFEDIIAIITKSDDGSITSGIMRSNCAEDTDIKSTACKLLIMTGDLK